MKEIIIIWKRRVEFLLRVYVKYIFNVCFEIWDMCEIDAYVYFFICFNLKSWMIETFLVELMWGRRI